MSDATLYIPEPGSHPMGSAVALPREEGRHARALRLRPGDEVRVTDGDGRVWRARLERDDGRPACAFLERVEPPPPLPVELGFGVAAKDRTLWLVEKAVELGVLSLQPVEFRRSRSVADAGRSPGFWRKASRRAVSALKQCGGARLPEIGPVRDLHAYLDRERRPSPSGAPVEGGPDVLLDRRAGRPLDAALEGWDGDPPLRLLLGPEGGLEPEERDACRRAGFVAASLGPRVLRFETAAVAGLSVAGQRLQAPSARAGEAGEPGIAADGRATSAGGRA